MQVCRGVTRPARTLIDDTDRLAALLSVCSDDAVVAGLSAARLHGLWLPDGTDGRLEVIVNSEQRGATRRSYHRRPQIRARRQDLAGDDVQIVDGIAVTTPARTWIDLADRLLPADLVALGDSVLRLGTAPELLDEVVREATHRRGVIRARGVVPMLDGRSRSRPESHMRFALLDDGLPAPEVNVTICSEHGEWLFEPDLSYDDVRLAMEYNGRFHAEVDRMRADITRTLDAEDRGGWRVVTFGPAQVLRRPEQVARRVRRLRLELSRARTTIS